MATILAPRLLLRFLAVLVPAPPPACWDPQISPLMLELRTTFLEAPDEAGPGSPLNMVPGAAGPQAARIDESEPGVPHHRGLCPSQQHTPRAFAQGFNRLLLKHQFSRNEVKAIRAGSQEEAMWQKGLEVGPGSR